jgi:hypothetical protein
MRHPENLVQKPKASLKVGHPPEGLRNEGSEIAYYKARASLVGLEPVCGPELGYHAASQLIIGQLDIAQRQEEIREAIRKDGALGFKGKIRRTLLNLP